MSLLLHELKNKKHRNWIKACLSFKYSAEGLVGFVDRHIREQHADCLNNIKKKHGDLLTENACTVCKIKTLKPAHDCVNKMCPLNHPNCNCMRPNGKLACPNKICSEMYDCMIMLHKNGNPNWQNTSISEWYSNCWEIAKSCIPGKGYVKKKAAIETDIAGLLWVVINNKDIQKHLQCIINAKTDVFTKTRDKRNKLFHSTTLEYEDLQLEKLISDLILILEDPNELQNDTGSQNATKKLKQLKQDDCIIPDDEACCIIAEAMSEMEQNGIKSETKSSIAEIEQMSEPLQQAIKQHQSLHTVTKEKQEKLKHGKCDTGHMQKDDHMSNKTDTCMETEKFHKKQKLMDNVRLLIQAGYQEQYDVGFMKNVEHKDKRKRCPTQENNKKFDDMQALFRGCYQNHGDATSFVDIMRQEEEAEQKDKKKRRLVMKNEEDNSSNTNTLVNTTKPSNYWQRCRDECFKSANKEFDRGRNAIGSYFASAAREARQKMKEAESEEMLLPLRRDTIDLRQSHNEDAKHQLEKIFTGQIRRYCAVDRLIIVTGKEYDTVLGNGKQSSSKCMCSNIQLYLKKNQERFGYQYTEPNPSQNVGHFEVFFPVV